MKPKLLRFRPEFMTLAQEPLAEDRQADIEPGLEKVPVGTRAKIHLGVDGWVRRELYFCFSGNELYRTEETG